MRRCKRILSMMIAVAIICGLVLSPFSQVSVHAKKIRMTETSVRQCDLISPKSSHLANNGSVYQDWK